jgi:hypothetical protein
MQRAEPVPTNEVEDPTPGTHTDQSRPMNTSNSKAVDQLVAADAVAVAMSAKSL